MFEFHGWIAINEDDSDDVDSSVLNQRRELLCDAIAICIEKLQGPSQSFHLHRSFNGTAHLVFCGFHNHRDERIIEFFRQVGELQPYSYGKLHVRDDEDPRGFQNMMQEWTMARSSIYESTDAQMSPCIPSIEPE
jgi:Immunity protein 7